MSFEGKVTPAMSILKIRSPQKARYLIFEKKTSDRLVRPCIVKKLYKPDHLIYSSPLPLMLTHGPKHENFKEDAADLDIDRFS